MSSPRLALVALVSSVFLSAQSGAYVHGSVVDARSGQPIVAEVRLLQPGYHVSCDSAGRFSIPDLGPGEYRLEISATGYQTLTTRFHTELGGSKSVSVALSPYGDQHRDSIAVRSDMSSIDTASGGKFTLTNSDMKNLATVIADDPFRAIQALPGVTSNDDFQARFSLRGADFSRIGIYVDGIQLHNAVHSLEGTDLSGSASAFNPAVVNEMTLHSGAFSERFANSSAGVVDVHMRDPDNDRYSLKFTANLGSAGLAAAGPLGRLDRCSWTGAFRKSYLQYLLARTLTDPSMAFGIEDGEGRVGCRASASSRLSIDLMDSYTDLDRSSLRQQLGANALMLAGQHSTVANLGWLYSPSNRLIVDNHLALLNDSFDDANALRNPVGEGRYQEWVANSSATWMWNAHSSFSAGVSGRRISDSGFEKTFQTFKQVEVVDQYRGQGSLLGGFLEQSWTGWNGRLHLLGSGRWDRHSTDGVTAFSPQASVALDVLPSLKMQLGWGRYVQFPAISQFGSDLGSPRLPPAHTNQATASLEQRIGQTIRLHVEIYDRQDRDLLYQPFLDPRLIGGQLFVPPPNPMYANSLRGYGRGMEVYVQRSSHNGLTGWVSYAYGRTGMHDDVTGDSFPSDWDQRHTINAYASYLLRPTVNLSSRWTYGSGFPAPGFFSVSGPVEDQQFFLSDRRNRVRIGPYQRLDVRVNKTWAREKWKKTLYAEVMNVTNKANYRFGSLDGYARSNGFAYVSVDRMFPILPSVGIVFER